MTLTREKLGRMSPAEIAKLDWADVRRVLSGEGTRKSKIDTLKSDLAAARSEVKALQDEVDRLRGILIEALEPGVFGLQDRSGISAPEDFRVLALGEEIGFGALMDSAQRMWKRVAREIGHPGSEFTIGCCAATHQNWIARAQEALAKEQGK